MRATLTHAHRVFRLPVAAAALVLSVLLSPHGTSYAAEAVALSAGEQVALVAASQVGAPYRWGGASPAGFDCTGFVQWVYGQMGVFLPRTEAGQLGAGMAVAAADLQPGDVLVFANTYRRGLSHTGIYLGEGMFVHAVDERRGVLVSSLWSDYWTPRLVGASRPLS